MQAGDEAFQRLRRSIEELADDEVAGLVAEARVEARARVRAILVDALAQALLDRAEGEIPPAQPASRRARDRPEPARRETVVPATDRAAAISDAGAAASGAERAAAPTIDRATPGPASSGSAPGRVASGGEALGVYVYCVVGGENATVPEALAGVDPPHPVTLVSEGGLAAVASPVPLDQFGEESLRDNLNDVAWLEDKARAHEHVLERVRERTTVIPMRLCTIYRSEASVREMLTRESVALSDALTRLARRTEWGVKVFVDRDALDRRLPEDSPGLAELTREVERAGAGEAYLLRRRLEELRGEEGERVLEDRCGEAHARLSSAAVEALLNPLQPRDVTGHPGEMVLNGVYLVDDGVTDQFHGAVAALAEEYRADGFDVQLTGPWPPYNFVKGSIEAAW
jgi:hypothetical protein